MDLYTFVLCLVGMLLLLVLGLAGTRTLTARYAAQRAESRRMSQLARSRTARSRRDRDEDEDDADDDEDDEGDDVDDLFATLDSNPVLAGMAKGYAAQNGLDLEAVRRREPAALVKAQALLQKATQPQAVQGVNYL